jgi:SHS2 domain-containing protein
MWEHFAHQADIGIRGIGATLEEAFAEAAYALMAVMCKPETVRPAEAVSVRAAMDDRELLLIEWLNQILYESDTRKMFFSRFEVKIEGNQLTGVLRGERMDPARHEPGVEVKAATYQMLRVAFEQGRWIAQCVVDV